MEHWRNGDLLYTETGTNTFTTEGMAKLLNIMFHDISKAASHIWYVGIFKNNITPALADTAAKLGSGNAYGECQDADYDDPLTNRPAYTTEDTSTAVITNVNAKAHFVMNASITVYGAFLADTAAKTSAYRDTDVRQAVRDPPCRHRRRRDLRDLSDHLHHELILLITFPRGVA